MVRWDEDGVWEEWRGGLGEVSERRYGQGGVGGMKMWFGRSGWDKT